MTNEDLNEQKIRGYQERYRFWSDKRISQLSFHNNLMLTIGFLVIGYFWEQRDSIYINVIIDLDANIDLVVVLFLLGMLSIFFSIVSGFLLSLSRLYDLRLTSNKILARKWALEEGIEIKDESLKQSCFKDSIKSLFCVFNRYEDYGITNGDIKNDNSLQIKFTTLRQKSNDIGVSTWRLLKCQTVSMLISIILFMIVLVIK